MKNLALFPLLFISIVHAQESGFALYDGPLNFKPFAANTFEPRVGLIWHADGNLLRLDIGNSIDLLQYTVPNERRLWTLGADFFTYTLLRGERNFHFPVDAIDYLFGFNVAYRDTIDDGVISSRLRVSHISAHFADGHFDNTTSRWKGGVSPRVYSREFLDLAVAYESGENIRYYAGTLYLWHIDPATLPANLLYVGSEFHMQVRDAVHLFAAYQFTATGMRPRHEVHMGTKTGNWNGRGTLVYFTYHNGNSIHGEYYDRKDEYSGIGFNMEF